MNHQTRPPIVAILGHVDHGKTTLLDYIRKAHIAAKEAGGITQSIGAYQATFKDKLLTFIDTPGHAAFSKMRSRGASVADIAVLVVSSDDGVMPQTIESIKHIQAAGIPFVVAINKIDKEGANPELPKAQLTEHQVFVEGYGGNTPFVLISGKTGKNVDQLLETILLLSELEELESKNQSPLNAPIIESQLDPKRGALVSAIVKEGTMNVGDTIYVGTLETKVRALIDYTGSQIKQALPSTPIQILGFKDVPAVGEIITSISTPVVANYHSPLQSTEFDPSTPHLNIILRTDTIGSLEALKGSFASEINLLSASTGDVTESDILLASTTNSLVLAFGVKVGSSVTKLAETEGVTIKSYKIIYELLEYIEKKVFKLMEPTIDEEVLGQGTILKVFDINGDHIGGTRVDSGKISVGDTIHLKRGEVTKEAKIRNLRIGKNDVKEVATGSECGVFFSPNLDIREKDVIIPYKKLKTDD